MTQSPDSLLIVDDDIMIRDVMLRYLSKHGFNASAETSGKGALEWINSHHVDIVLLDIEMPEMNGLDVLKTLRKTYTLVELPVIMVTGRASRDVVEAAQAAGANDYVFKPIDFPDLIARIQSHLSRKCAQETLRKGKKHYTLTARGANDRLWD